MDPDNIKRHAIFVGRSRMPVIIQPENHTWRPSKGATGWHIRVVPPGIVYDGYVDPKKHTLVEEYKGPVPAPRPRPITNWEGSWAASVGARKP